MRLLFGCFLCFCLVTPVFAEDDSARPETTTEVVDRDMAWQQMVTQAILMIKLNKIEEAEALSRLSVERAEEYYGQDNPRTAQALNDWGYVLRMLERYEEAEAAHRRSLDIRAEHLDPTHALVVQAKSNLAKDLFYQNELEESRDLFEELRRGFGDSPESTSVREAEFMVFLGFIADAQARNEEAGALYKDALEVYARELPPTDPRLIELVQRYAAWLRSEKRQAEAAALEKQYLGSGPTE